MVTVHKVQRLMLATGFALCVGLPILACSGSVTTDTPATDAPPDAPQPPAEDLSKRLVGTWRMMPPEDKLREMKIIAVAISDGPPQKKEKQLEKLGKLTPDEQKLFDEWSKKSGNEVKEKRNEIRFTKNTNFEFTDTQVTIRFGEDDVNGPFPYTVVNATESNTTVTFDPGFGNGLETHSFDWKSPTEGTDNITGATGKTFIPLGVKKN